MHTERKEEINGREIGYVGIFPSNLGFVKCSQTIYYRSNQLLPRCPFLSIKNQKKCLKIERSF